MTVGAGLGDAGTTTMAMDAGTGRTDAGTTGHPASSGGCGCTVAVRPPMGAAWVVPVAMLEWKRRRARRA